MRSNVTELLATACLDWLEKEDISLTLLSIFPSFYLFYFVCLWSISIALIPYFPSLKLRPTASIAYIFFLNLFFTTTTTLRRLHHNLYSFSSHSHYLYFKMSPVVRHASPPAVPLSVPHTLDAASRKFLEELIKESEYRILKKLQSRMQVEMSKTNANTFKALREEIRNPGGKVCDSQSSTNHTKE